MASGGSQTYPKLTVFDAEETGGTLTVAPDLIAPCRAKGCFRGNARAEWDKQLRVSQTHMTHSPLRSNRPLRATPRGGDFAMLVGCFAVERKPADIRTNGVHTDLLSPRHGDLGALRRPQRSGTVCSRRP
jgi:hypothetical protein